MKKKILIIDDFEPLLEEITEFLNIEGYIAVSASDGAEGIQAAMQHCPDLIICDIQMPKLNGYEVYKTLETIPRTASIPFIFLTALTQTSDFRKGMELGADDYLIKPFEIETLLTTIKKRLQKHDIYKKAEKFKFEAMMESPLYGTFIANSKKVVFINPKLTELTGYTLKEINQLSAEKILLGNKSKIISDFKLCLSGVHDTFFHKLSALNSDKVAFFLNVFGKHIIIEGEDVILGTVVNHSFEEAKDKKSEISEITNYLKQSGKEDLAEEILNVRSLLSFNTEKGRDDDFNKLSKRELQVLELICKGDTNHEIAEKLFISSRTVDNHRAKLISKTQTKNTASLVVYAIKNKLVEL